jgi:serine/threonine protein kinase
MINTEVGEYAYDSVEDDDFEFTDGTNTFSEIPLPYSDQEEEEEEDSEEEGYSHVLMDNPRSTIKHDPSKIRNVSCSNSKIKIHERCDMNWAIGAKLATGKGAVVYDLYPNDDDEFAKVARISQLNTRADRQKFKRDVHVRYILSCACRCKNKQITGLIDAFICTKLDNENRRYGVTISRKYDDSLSGYLLKLSSLKARDDYIIDATEGLTSAVNDMHACGIYHKDLVHGNVLVGVKDQKLTFVLTDFEDAHGKPFHKAKTKKQRADEARYLNSYKNSDRAQVKELIEQLKVISKYMDGQHVDEEDLLEAMDVLDISRRDF